MGGSSSREMEEKGLEDSKDFLGGEDGGVDDEEGLGLKGADLGGASADDATTVFFLLMVSHCFSS